LIDFFSVRFAERYQRPRWKPDSDTLKDFCEFGWPGNIRQLQHVIEQAYVLDCLPMLPIRAQASRSRPSLPFTDLNRLRYFAVRQALETTRGHKGRAAKLLGVHANTLTRLLSQMARQGDDLNSIDGCVE